MTPARSPRDDRGSGSVLVVAMVACLLLVLSGALVLVEALVDGQRARTAADLGAVAAAADAARGDAAPCDRARAVVTGNRAQLRSCSVAGAQVRLRVEVPRRLGGPPAVAEGRAGPAS